jgi:pSer/pThr/pTyr-binding forkhead associated (FHA) protein
MDEKRKILDKIMPRAVLKAMSAEAVEAIPQNQRVDDMVVIRTFPFRIGRESRVRSVNGILERTERSKMADREPNNDLYLVDAGKLLNISREHLQIEKQSDSYTLLDRGSACGTKVEGLAVGGEDSGGTATLRDGDVISIGTSTTPYVYRFIVLDEE